MKFLTYILILTVLSFNFQIVAGAENEYGIVKAWFNGRNATVNDIQLKIGESAEVKVEVISKIKGDASLILREPGVTNAFDVLDGPSKEEWLTNMNIEPGWSKTYTWTVVPNGAWKGGKAPLNIVVQFNKGMTDKKIQFTIANPYILDEQYSGAATTTSAPEITGTGASAKPAPFLPIIFTVSALLLAWRLKKS